MKNSPEQYKFNFEEPKKPELPKVIEVETEEKIICDYCNQKYDSKEGGCRYCSNDRMQLQKKKENERRISH